jgi:hypothetical protein
MVAAATVAGATVAVRVVVSKAVGGMVVVERAAQTVAQVLQIPAVVVADLNKMDLVVLEVLVLLLFVTQTLMH